MDKKVKVIVLRTAGTNCNEETQIAFQECGADVDSVHINKLFSGEKKLTDYHILAIPGGFSYGDDIASGKILANELRLGLKNDLKQFIEDGKLIIGICNGFQVLVKAGILPGSKGGSFAPEATLFTNDSGKFEDRWIYLQPQGRSVWLEGLKDPIYLPVAHGEGKFIPQDQKVLERLKKNDQVVFRYHSPAGKKPHYPENPNGSVDDIAGICDETGRVFGLMPHPERHFRFTQHPYWTRLEKKTSRGDGAKIFENGVRYVKENLM